MMFTSFKNTSEPEEVLERMLNEAINAKGRNEEELDGAKKLVETIEENIRKHNEELNNMLAIKDKLGSYQTTNKDEIDFLDTQEHELKIRIEDVKDKISKGNQNLKSAKASEERYNKAITKTDTAIKVLKDISNQG